MNTNEMHEIGLKYFAIMHEIRKEHSDVDASGKRVYFKDEIVHKSMKIQKIFEVKGLYFITKTRVCLKYLIEAHNKGSLTQE